MSELSVTTLSCIQDCAILLSDFSNFDLVIQRLESIIIALEVSSYTPPWKEVAIGTIDAVIRLLNEPLDIPRAIGRPRITLPVHDMEFLLSLKFKLNDIAKMCGVSRDTVSRRLQEVGVSVAQSYTQIEEETLNTVIIDILRDFPNTGYKRMKGFLLSRGIKVADKRVRIAMRTVDPDGVYIRTRCNRAIVRRQYHVTYFNELWHLDTNMKLIRWNIVIRACIDGRSRQVLYLDASGDNTAKTNLDSFLKAVTRYGVPIRTRSDKGGENVLIARFMILNRGTGRGSHICGRSVHNQRIERYWRDVYYGFTAAIANIITSLEQDGHLDINNPKHLYLLHFVFLERINESLETFRLAWNNHPLSSESNYTPNQLMLLCLPPSEVMEHKIVQEEDDYLCETLESTSYFDQEDSIQSPMQLTCCLSETEITRLSEVDISRRSEYLGYDIYVGAVALLNS